MAHDWTRRGLISLFTVAVGTPALIVVGGVTGWSRSAIGVPTWVSWTLAVPAILVGLPLAWFCTPMGTESSISMLLRIYRREGLDAAEQLLPARFGPYRIGRQMFNLAFALEREGDHIGAEAAYRRAVVGGYPPAMLNLANQLARRGENAEAVALYGRAAEAGLDQEAIADQA